MKKSTKRITVIATIMIVSGILLTVIGYFSGAKLTLTSDGNRLKAFDSRKQVSESFSLDSFTNIEGNLDDVDFEIIPSTEYKVEITRQENQKITHEIKNNTLYLNEKSSGALNGGIIKFNIDLGFVGTPQSIIKLYVPKDTIFSAINLVSEYGNVHIDGITSTNFTIEANDGDMVLKGISSDVLTVTNSYGNITAEDLKGEQTKFVTNDGDLSLKRLNIKTLNVSNDYGDSGIEDITSTDMTVSMSDGDIKINNEQFEGSVTQTANSTHQLNITAADGDVNLQF